MFKVHVQVYCQMLNYNAALKCLKAIMRMSFFNNQSSIFACSANEYSSSRVSREEGGNVADKKAGLLTRDHAAHNNSIS
jgi:hypothetical protein